MAMCKEKDTVSVSGSKFLEEKMHDVLQNTATEKL
jgi:hypothetical protein